jgi:hypothetical protein
MATTPPKNTARRSNAPEEDSQEIERERAEDHALAADVAKPLDQVLHHRDGPAGERRRCMAYHQQCA